MPVSDNASVRELVTRELNRVIPHDFPFQPVSGLGCVFYRVVPKKHSLEVSVVPGYIGAAAAPNFSEVKLTEDDAIWLTNRQVLGECLEGTDVKPLKVLPRSVNGLRVNLKDRLMQFVVKLP